MAPFALPPDAHSLCWSCKYYEWALELRGGGESDWVKVCNNPAEYVAGDDVKICEGYKNGNNSPDKV